MNLRLALRWGAYGSLFLTALVMWYPAHSLAGVNISGHGLQTFAFAVNAFLFAILDDRHPERYPPFVAVDDFVTIASVRWGRHVLRVSILCVLYAAVLEIGQFLAPSRVAGITGFMDNAGTVLITTGLVYVGARVFLSNHRLRRLALRRLVGAATSFRSEMEYAGMLRDGIQEAYAISHTDRPAEAKVAEIAARLNKVLGADLPVHHENLLNSAFGKRSTPVMTPLAAVNLDEGMPQSGELLGEGGGRPRPRSNRPLNRRAEPGDVLNPQ
jgi:hypothetical protein